MKKGWVEVNFGDILDLDLDAVVVNPIEKYDMAGVLSYGKGLFMKPPVSGADTSYKTFFRLNDGQIVLSQLFGWEGAIALVEQEFSGRFVSSQFPTFKPKANLDLQFAKWIFRFPQVWEQLKSAAKGMGDRRRTLTPEIFFDVKTFLPISLKEQKRIATHLNTIEKHQISIQKLKVQNNSLNQAFIVSLHHFLSENCKVSMDELLYLDEEKESVVSDGLYPQVGIRSFGNGMFTKPAIAGSETTYKTFNILRKGKLILSQVKGWEGAIAVCPALIDGWYVSPEYRTFSCRESKCDPEYLSYIVVTEWFHKHLLSATRGVGARRERVRPEKFLCIELPFPDFFKQKMAVKILSQIHQVRKVSNKVASQANAILPSLLDRIFNHK
jgi:type I restriction enzyme, S subunit